MKPWQRWLVRAGWLVVALPALYQIACLIYTIGHRVGYPYDLEWMEGGMLHHAQRIADGDGIYGPPSIGFIPYLYTPLYPGVLAFLGGIFGIGYALGRWVSVLSLLGLAGVTAAAIAGPTHRAARAGADDRAAGWLGVATALGLWAAAYPFSGGWYDLVRNDSFFLLLATAGIHCAARWSRAGRGWGGHGRVAAVAALLALSFFAKQTGIFYVGAGGLIVLILAWRRVPTFVAVAGAIGLGGSWLLQRRSGGWFWHYVHDVHQAHDFNMDRFWASFGHILGHFPLMTATVGVGLAVVAVTAVRTRQVPPAARPLLLWAPMFALSTVVGAIGWGTEFAVWNAYMPAMLHGAIAAGCAVPAIAACARLLLPARVRRRDLVIGALAAAIAIAPGVDLVRARWSPRPYLPTTADRTANAELIQRIAAIDGDVWVTFEPWYAHLAGKPMFTHRMGIKDVTDRQPGAQVIGLAQALRGHRFAAIVLDQHGVPPELAAMTAGYRRDDKLPPEARPRLYLGPHPGAMGMPGQVTPDTVWVPAAPTKPPLGARILFDFESGRWDPWKVTGTAWGPHPEAREVRGQGPVYRFGGRFFADSMHGGDDAIGRLESPTFPIDGARITFRLAGGTDAHALRVELIVDDQVVVASTPSVAGDAMDQVAWDVSALRGKTGRIRVVDDARAAGGHLDVDDFLIWNDQTGTPAPASDRRRR